MKTRTIIAASLTIILLFSLMGCSDTTEEPGTIDWSDLDQRAELFVSALVNGDYSEAAGGFDNTMKKALSVNALKRAWEDTLKEAGLFISIVRTDVIPHDEYYIYEVISRHENKGVNTRVVFSEDDLIAGLFFSFTENPSDLDPTPVQKEGYTEIPVIIGEGTDYPLNGILSIPDNVSGALPAVVLVHGSGPIDMNGTAFGIGLLEVLAENLAQNGIAALRYNKRTFSHGAKLNAEYGDNLTVWEETIEDAILAKNLLLENEQIDNSAVYVLGHSLGGMLAPRIVSEGGFTGGIIMAGSARSLIDIIYDQNKYHIELMDISENERLALYEQVDEAREHFFNLPETYIAEMDAHPAEVYLAVTENPFLILQGGKDFQVSADVDFALYQEIAEGRENFTLRLYDELTHLFTVSTMEKPTIEDYLAGSSISKMPMSDIVEWVKTN